MFTEEALQLIQRTAVQAQGVVKAPTEMPTLLVPCGDGSVDVVNAEQWQKGRSRFRGTYRTNTLVVQPPGSDDPKNWRIRIGDTCTLNPTADVRGPSLDDAMIEAFAELERYTEEPPLTLEMVETALSLVSDTNASIELIASWAPEERERAYQWAMAVHYRASDNDDVEVPQRPDFIPPDAEADGGDFSEVTK